MRQSEYEARKREIEEHQKKLQEDLKKLESMTIENDVWQPKENEEYFYITSNFMVESTTNEMTKLDKDTILAGNCFKTYDIAKDYANYLMYNLQYRKFVKEHPLERKLLKHYITQIMPEAAYYIGIDNFNKYVLGE